MQTTVVERRKIKVSHKNDDTFFNTLKHRGSPVSGRKSTFRLSNFLSLPLRKQMIVKAYPQSLAANFHQTGSVYKSVCSDAFKGT